MLSESSGYFWRPEKIENLENSDFKNLKHFQKLEDFLLTERCIYHMKTSQKYQHRWGGGVSSSEAFQIQKHLHTFVSDNNTP